ncbi:hypothetical protein [uncultured Thiothrix sp.]|uniref:hypothetical protein n=1 Tax=uncultured Thiothrix sp. TaxID=223185 RepID=UPI00260E8C95|nr:hypothetical protein [uncultured Thiothrix sp.]HMT93944.1 hypothetical protein [Thiolinea sp.]
MRFILNSFLFFVMFYSTNALAEVYRPMPVFKGDKLLIVSQPPEREPVASLVTIRELDTYYIRLLVSLKRGLPELDAQSSIKLGQLYLLRTNAKMTQAQQASYQPANVMFDNAVSSAVDKVCHQWRVVEGENEYEYINTALVIKIQNKEAPMPRGQQLIPSSMSSSFPTKMIKLYQQVLAEYVSRWNSVMYAECKRLSGAPDINRIPPVKPTHKAIGNTVFILDEAPFIEPRSNTQSDLQKAIYQIRLAQAMRQKNVELDVQNAIRQQQTYFLGMKWVMVGDWFGPGAPPKNFRPRVVSYGIEEGNIDQEEAEKLAKVCPIRMLEGRDDLYAGLWGNVDLSNNPNSQAIQRHERLMRQSLQRIRTYEKRWNQTMLPICREKLKKQN